VSNEFLIASNPSLLCNASKNSLQACDCTPALPTAAVTQAISLGAVAKAAQAAARRLRGIYK
jgi:hypothetical protein